MGGRNKKSYFNHTGEVGSGLATKTEGGGGGALKSLHRLLRVA